MRSRLKRPDDHLDVAEDDPMAGVSNLFDLSLVFIVSLILVLFTVYQMQEFFDPNSEFTMVKTNADGMQEVIRKKGREIEAYKVTQQSLKGQGDRLGVAYRLKDGSIIYVPEGNDDVE